MLEIIRKIPVWIYLLLLGFIAFYTYDIRIAADMTWYMNSALNIYLGKGYTDMNGSLILNRGPIFPLMISASYWLFGTSPLSAFWVIRIFCILNSLIVYFLGEKLFGKWVGFSAALLILSSYSMNYWSYRHLDAVWPFFTLLSILTINSALEKKSYIYFILSAVFMGLAYLVKQAPILLFPLPFLLWALVRDYRNTKILKGSFLYIFFISIIISPWIYYVYFHTQNMKLALFSAGGETAASYVLNPDLFQVAKKYFLGILAYYHGGTQSLSTNFSIAPLFVCAWIVTIYKAVRGNRSNLLLVAVFFLLTPYISYVGIHDLRVGQLIFFLILSYLCVANFVNELSNTIVNGVKRLNHLKTEI